MKDWKQVTVYTDGACRGNPGRGGYGVVLKYGRHRKELSAGFRRTTNNRMELLAAVVALESLKEPCAVTLYSDSRYLVNAVTRHWLQFWQRNGWKKRTNNRWSMSICGSVTWRPPPRTAWSCSG